MVITTALIATLSLTSGLVYWLTPEQDPLEYLSGRVRIGVTSEKHPGWNTATRGSKGLGFDRELIQFLARAYGFEVELVELDSLGDAVDRLAGYRGAPDDIKLVISTYAITATRERVIDYAGPYYEETESLYTFERADGLGELPSGTVCVTEGARAGDWLTDRGWSLASGASLMDCLTRMKNPTDVVKAVAGGASILSESMRNIDGYGTPSEFKIGNERYAVAIPNNRPKLCEELNLKIRKFIENEWMGHIPENLPSVYDPRGHQPPIPLPTCMQPSS
ncbi:hypothetical protein Aglo03_52510 [Actinokineospora globicatena]|uniref:Solute-binding protein family 3/N-terminal domain-containing protein n=2 Tax=Actinokineospora globicatena TaxID=103729 RepID=A0A9W6QTC9_9PSEU|nr:hypothetical protein Aglo03_52510 [Actinokineospora globicatena]